MVKSVVSHLCCEQLSIVVERPEIQAAIADTLGVAVNVLDPGSGPADVALFPFSLEEGAQPAGERTIVVACYNSLSYKSLFYPLDAQGTVFGKLARLQTAYHLSPVAGLYSPRYILRLALAKIVERWNSAWYFRLEDRAMRQLIEYGPMWRLSYIVVVVGRNAG
jgi:hypothetical protein